MAQEGSLPPLCRPIASPPPNLVSSPPPKICRFYILETCAKGEHCAYSHSVPERSHPDFLSVCKTVPCPHHRRWGRGTCRYGDNCLLSHVKLNNGGIRKEREGGNPTAPRSGLFGEPDIAIDGLGSRDDDDDDDDNGSPSARRREATRRDASTVSNSRGSNIDGRESIPSSTPHRQLPRAHTRRRVARGEGGNRAVVDGTGRASEDAVSGNRSGISGNVPGRGDVNDRSRNIGNAKGVEYACVICIWNIDFATTLDDLLRACERFGPVVRCNLRSKLPHKRSRRCTRGFAYVTFASKCYAKSCVSTMADGDLILDGRDLHGCVFRGEVVEKSELGDKGQKSPPRSNNGGRNDNYATDNAEEKSSAILFGTKGLQPETLKTTLNNSTMMDIGYGGRGIDSLCCASSVLKTPKLLLARKDVDDTDGAADDENAVRKMDALVGEGTEECQIFVTNLNYNMSLEVVKTHIICACERFGPVVLCDIRSHHRKPNGHKGFAFVILSSMSCAVSCVSEINAKLYLGKIKVKAHVV